MRAMSMEFNPLPKNASVLPTYVKLIASPVSLQCILLRIRHLHQRQFLDISVAIKPTKPSSSSYGPENNRKVYYVYKVYNSSSPGWAWFSSFPFKSSPIPAPHVLSDPLHPPSATWDCRSGICYARSRMGMDGDERKRQMGHQSTEQTKSHVGPAMSNPHLSPGRPLPTCLAYDVNPSLTLPS